MELECRLLLAQHSVSRLVDRMAAKSMARKREAAGDGRGHLVELTQEGRAMQKEMWPICRWAIQRYMGARLEKEEAE